MQEGGGTKRVEIFSEAYQKAKRQRLVKIIRAPQGDPARQTTFIENMTPWAYPFRRAGRPKVKWASQAAKNYWEQIMDTLTPPHTNVDLDVHNENQFRLIIDSLHPT